MKLADEHVWSVLSLESIQKVPVLKQTFLQWDDYTNHTASVPPQAENTDILQK